MWLRNKEFFKSYAQQNRYYRFTDFIAIGNKEKFLKTHLNSQSYCLRKVPGQTCEAAFRGTCFQASRSDSIHSCDLLCFSLAAVLAAPFRLSPVRHFQLRVNCRLKKELPCERGCLDLTSWVDGSSTEREKSWSYQYHEFKISGVKWSKGKWKLPRVSGRFDLPGVDCCFFFLFVTQSWYLGSNKFFSTVCGPCNWYKRKLPRRTQGESPGGSDPLWDLTLVWDWNSQVFLHRQDRIHVSLFNCSLN